MPNASSKKDVEKLEKLEHRTRADELRDLGRFCLNTRAGRRYFWNLIEFCGVNEISYTRGDVHETTFREGMRNCGNKILIDIVDCNPDIYALMRKEYLEDKDARDTSSGSAEPGSGSDAEA